MKRPFPSLAVCALTAGVLAADPAPAQAPAAAPPAIGARLRVSTTAPGTARHIGAYEGLRDTMLLLRSRPAVMAIALRSISRVEVSGGVKRSTAGGVVGLLLGAGAGGFVFGCLANRDSYGVMCAGQDDTKVVVGAIIGGLVGGALGATLFRKEKWTAVDVALLRAR